MTEAEFKNLWMQTVANPSPAETPVYQPESDASLRRRVFEKHGVFPIEKGQELTQVAGLVYGVDGHLRPLFLSY